MNFICLYNFKISVLPCIGFTYLSLLALCKAPPLREHRQQSWGRNTQVIIQNTNSGTWFAYHHIENLMFRLMTFCSIYFIL